MRMEKPKFRANNTYTFRCQHPLSQEKREPLSLLTPNMDHQGLGDEGGGDLP